MFDMSGGAKGAELLAVADIRNDPTAGEDRADLCASATRER